MQHFSPILRRVLGILAFCFFGSQLYSQNLIPNGSFEEGINCPSTIGNITEECTAWYASLIDNEGPNPTPDWFHECSEFDLLAPPDIAFGYQLPYEGGGYVGLATFSSNHSEAREIVGVELLEPLAIGETYLVEFFLTEVSNIGFAIFTNNIGYNFSTHPFYDVANFPINTSHFSIDTVVHSSSEWTQVISEFTADSNYTHFHIGNFYDDASTDTVLAGGVAGYYLIDYVSISQSLSYQNPIDRKKSTFNIFPNPVYEKFIVASTDQFTFQRIVVTNSSGQIISVRNLPKESSHCEMDVSSLTKGLYIIQIETPKSIYYEKFIKL